MKRAVLYPLAVIALALFAVPGGVAQAPLPLMDLPPHVDRILAGQDPAFPEGGTLLEVRGQWRCDRPIESYAVNGMPLVVNQVIANSASPNQPGAVRIGNTAGTYPATGCTVSSQRRPDGPDADTFPECAFDQRADVFLYLNGNRTDIGSNTDIVKSIGAHCIEFGDPTHPAGQWIAGSVGAGEHQDCLNTNYGRDMHFYGLEIGDWETQSSGAHGAGGCWYMSQLRDIAIHHANIVCFGCKIVASPHPGGGPAGTGFSLYGSERSGMVDSCIAARRPFIDRLPYNSPGNAYSPVNTGNFFLDRDASNQPPASACPLFGDDTPPPLPPECGNGRDDDNDGRIDFPADLGCTSPTDDSESPDPPPPAPQLSICANGPTVFTACWPPLTGVIRFNFYRDNAFLSHSNNGALTAVRFGKLSGTHTYGVGAVYAGGAESRSELTVTRGPGS